MTFLHSPSLPSSHSSWSLTWRHSPSLPSSHRPSLARASAASLAACSAVDRADRRVSAESPPLDPDAWLPPPSPSRSSPSLVLRPASHPSPKASPKAHDGSAAGFDQQWAMDYLTANRSEEAVGVLWDDKLGPVGGPLGRAHHRRRPPSKASVARGFA